VHVAISLALRIHSAISGYDTPPGLLQRNGHIEEHERAMQPLEVIPWYLGIKRDLHIATHQLSNRFHHMLLILLSVDITVYVPVSQFR